MFDIGWTELLVIGVVALIVVGPKDLPGMFRTLGRFTGKMRGMARDFQRAMNEAADETGVKDIADDLKSATSARRMGLDKLSEAATKFESWEPGKSARETKKGPETQKLSEERAEIAKNVRDAGARMATERKAAEAAVATGDAAGAHEKPAAAAKPKKAAKPKSKPKSKPAKAATTAAKSADARKDPRK